MRTLVVAMLLLAPLASAQGIYMDDEILAAGETGNTSYPLTEEAPIGEEAGKAYAATAFGALAYTTDWSYTVQTGFVVEDTMTATAFISCDTETAFRPGVSTGPNPVATARMEFTKGGAVIETVDLYSTRTCDGPSDIWEAVFLAENVAGTDFPAGTTYGVNLILWVPNGSPSTGAENVYVLTGSTIYPSGIVGAGLPGSAVDEITETIVEQNITDGFEHSWASPHNTTYRFNASLESDMVTTIIANVTAGAANMTITGADGELLNATIENGTHVYDMAAGNWTIDVAYDAFVGDLALGLAEPAMDDHMDDMDHMDGNMTDDGNMTAEEPPQEDSPGLAIVAILGVIAVIARRRK